MGEAHDQQQARDEFADVEVKNTPAKAIAVGRDDDELAGVEGERGAVSSRDEALAFEHHDFKTAVGEDGADNGGAEDRC